MKSVLAFVLFFASCLAAVVANAQIVSQREMYVNRQPAENAHAAPAPKILSATHGLVDTIFQSTLDVSDGNLHDFTGKIKNAGKDSALLYFVRNQTLPAGWNTSICFGDLCYGPDVDVSGQIFGPGDSNTLTIHINPAMSDYPDSCTLYLRLGDSNATTNDSSLYILKAYFTPGPNNLIFQFNDSKSFDWSFLGTGKHTIKRNFQNRAGVETAYKFAMQSVMPTGWADTLHVAHILSTPDLLDTIGAVNQGFDIQLMQIDVYTSTPFTHKDSAICFVSVHPQGALPKDSANYRFSAVVNDFSFATPTKNNFIGKGPHTDSGTFTNYSMIPVTYRFSAPANLPKSWSSSFSVGDSSSDGHEISYTFAGYGDAANNHRSVAFTITNPDLTAPDSAQFAFRVYRADDLPDSGGYQLPIYVAASSAVTTPQSQSERAGIAVTNAWPNPIVSTSRLNLEIVTDRIERAFARIYDITGVEKAVVDLGQLNMGTNQVQLGAFGLASGEYIIRIEQGEAASEPVRVNYVK